MSLKRRTPLKRTPLARGSSTLSRGEGLKRTSIAKVNRKRKARVDAETFGVQAEWCRSQACCCCGAPDPSDPHHEPPRSVGGKDRHTLPMCRKCHRLRHDRGVETFWCELSPVRLLAARAAVRDAMRGPG